MRFSLTVPALLCVLFTCPAYCSAQNEITYRVEPHVTEKTYRVEITIPRNHELTVRLQMPVWMPGAYFVGNFATNVSDVVATDPAKHPLRLFHPDPNTWEVAANGATTVSFSYTVKNADLEAVSGTPRRGHISGPRTYMYVVGRKTEPVALELKTPDNAKLWNVITSLDPTDSKQPAGAARYKAPGYDVLADAPVEMGDFADEQFVSGGKPHHVVMYGDYSTTDRAKLTDYCKRIADTEIEFFGVAPFHRYIFQFRCASGPGRGAGGLEHLGSTEISTVSQVEDRVRSVIAHEYFHLWNVKRIRPFVLGPFNYVDPPHTANLWWSEGVTSYYGDLLSERGGLNSRDQYLKHLSDTIGLLQNNPARLTASADESSLRVWDANNSVGFGGLSYYTKGELVGLCLDLKIRQLTNGAHSLDDVMRALFAQVKQGDGPGFQEDDIKKTVNRIAGADLSAFYDSVARSTDELPFAECLQYVGLSLKRVEPATMQSDSGMRFQFDRTAGGLSVSEVVAGGAADMAGIKVGDRITAVNGVTDRRGLGQALNAAKPGAHLKLTVSHSGSESEIYLTMGSRSVYNWAVENAPDATAQQAKLRDQWLGDHH